MIGEAMVAVARALELVRLGTNTAAFEGPFASLFSYPVPSRVGLRIHTGAGIFVETLTRPLGRAAKRLTLAANKRLPPLPADAGPYRRLYEGLWASASR